MNEALDNLHRAVDNLFSVVYQEWRDHTWRFLSVYVLVVAIAFIADALIG